MWNSLEVAKLVAGIATPLSVLWIGWIANKRLKAIDEYQWRSRKVVEKRIEIFDRLSSDLNKLYCFFMWIGDWQETTPEEAISIKRRLDKGFYVNRFILGEEAFYEYQQFIHLTFQPFAGAGKDALLLTSVVGPGGDRRASRHFSWKNEWDDLFSSKDTPDRNGIHEAYDRMMHQFSRSIGL